MFTHNGTHKEIARLSKMFKGLFRVGIEDMYTLDENKKRTRGHGGKGG